MSDPTKQHSRAERIATALAATLLVATLAPLAWQLGWILELPAHFRPHSIAAGIALAAAGLIRRRHVITAMSIAALALSVYPVIVTPETAHEDASGIVVVSQNLWRMNDDTVMALDALRAQEADVLVLQEYTPAWHAALAPLAAQYAHTIRYPQEGSFGIAVFANLSPKAERTLRLGARGLSAIVIDIDEPDAAFRLIALHLSPPMSADLANDRNRQLEELAVYVNGDQMPVVLAGDFNNTPSSPTFRRFLAKANLRFAGSHLAPTWPAQLGPFGAPIDLAVASDDVAIGCYRTIGAIGSDHRGIRFCAGRR